MESSVVLEQSLATCQNLLILYRGKEEAIDQSLREENRTSKLACLVRENQLNIQTIEVATKIVEILRLEESVQH